MPGVVRLINRNIQASVKSVYSYSNKWQLRSIISLWEKDNNMGMFWIHVLPKVTDDPELIKDLK